MLDQLISDLGKHVKVIKMDGNDGSAALQSVLDDENITAVILTGRGIIKSPILVKQKCDIYGLNADLLVEDDIEAFKFETGGIRIKGINFYAVKEQGTSEYKNQCAVNMGRTLDNSIAECLFEGFGFCAIAHSKAVGRHQGNRISNCVFKNNSIGFAAFERGEYNQLTQCTLYNNNIAIHIQGGNTNISGCIISDNEIGIRITEGDNHGHGVITGRSINHNDKPFVIHNVTYGFIINGCPIYCGDLVLESARYIKFSNCDLSHIRFHVRSSKDIYCSNCHMIRYDVDTDDKDSLIFTNCII